MTLKEAAKDGVPTLLLGVKVKAEVIEHARQKELWNLDDLMAQGAEMLDDDIEEYHFYDVDGVKIR